LIPLFKTTNTSIFISYISIKLEFQWFHAGLATCLNMFRKKPSDSQTVNVTSLDSPFGRIPVGVIRVREHTVLLFGWGQAGKR
jgi:hypothetical protein